VLVCVRVAPDHDRRTFGDTPVALPQMARVAPREIDQFFQRGGIVARFDGGRRITTFGRQRPQLQISPAL